MNSQNPFSLATGASRGGEPMLFRNRDLVLAKISGVDTQGRVAIFETTVSPGAGPVLHRHHAQNEWWYVLEGQFLFQVGDERFRSQPGGSVFGPRGLPHAFRCTSKEPGKVLMSFDPAGQIEAFFTKLATLGADAGAGRHNEKELLQQYGLEFVGPPLTED